MKIIYTILSVPLLFQVAQAEVCPSPSFDENTMKVTLPCTKSAGSRTPIELEKFAIADNTLAWKAVYQAQEVVDACLSSTAYCVDLDQQEVTINNVKIGDTLIGAKLAWGDGDILQYKSHHPMPVSNPGGGTSTPTATDTNANVATVSSKTFDVTISY